MLHVGRVQITPIFLDAEKTWEKLRYLFIYALRVLPSSPQRIKSRTP